MYDQVRVQRLIVNKFNDKNIDYNKPVEKIYKDSNGNNLTEEIYVSDILDRMQYEVLNNEETRKVNDYYCLIFKQEKKY